MSVFHTAQFAALNGLDTVIIEGEHDFEKQKVLVIGPKVGTYGGFKDAYPIETMEALLSGVDQRCTIKLAPASHDLQLFSRSMNVLHRAGFLLEYADLNYDMPVGTLDFTERLASGARKKLAKCQRAGFDSRVLERHEWRHAHKLIWTNRHRAGRELSLGLDKIEELESVLPGTYIFFGTFDGNRMIAAAICVMVRADILYVYAWADAEKNEFAPTVHLCQRIYEEACYKGCRLLDAGISTEKGVPNTGLIAFKESLGFLPSVKATMRRA